MKRKLGTADWIAVLTRLSEVLPPGPARHVTVIGGVAMLLGYGARRTTDDADVVMTPEVAADVLPAAVSVAHEFGLDPDWLNQKALEANLLVRPESSPHIVFSMPSLVLEAPPIEHMLAMKVVAYRNEKDIRDAKILAEHLRRHYKGGMVGSEAAWRAIVSFVPLAKRDKARTNLRNLWARFF